MIFSSLVFLPGLVCQILRYSGSGLTYLVVRFLSLLKIHRLLHLICSMVSLKVLFSVLFYLSCILLPCPISLLPLHLSLITYMLMILSSLPLSLPLTVLLVSALLNLLSLLFRLGCLLTFSLLTLLKLNSCLLETLTNFQKLTISSYPYLIILLLNLCHLLVILVSSLTLDCRFLITFLLFLKLVFVTFGIYVVFAPVLITLLLLLLLLL